MKELSKEKESIQQFLKLKNNIGSIVICKSYQYGTLYEITGELMNVNFFRNIEVNYSTIPFISSESTIKEIISDATGEIIYNSPLIEENYNRRTEEEVEILKRKIYGNKVVDKQNIRRIKKEEYSNKIVLSLTLKRKN